MCVPILNNSDKKFGTAVSNAFSKRNRILNITNFIKLGNSQFNEKEKRPKQMIDIRTSEILFLQFTKPFQFLRV